MNSLNQSTRFQLEGSFNKGQSVKCFLGVKKGRRDLHGYTVHGYVES